jgi:hypothetical protein
MGSESTEDESVRKSLPVTMLVVIDTQVQFGIRPKRGAAYRRQKVVRYGLILRQECGGCWTGQSQVGIGIYLCTCLGR